MLLTSAQHKQHLLIVSAKEIRTTAGRDSRSRSFFAANSFPCHKPASLPRIALYSCELFGQYQQNFSFLWVLWYPVRRAKQGTAKPLLETRRQSCNKCPAWRTGFEAAIISRVKICPPGYWTICFPMHVLCSFPVEEHHIALNFSNLVMQKSLKFLVLWDRLCSGISMPWVWPCNSHLDLFRASLPHKCPGFTWLWVQFFCLIFDAFLVWSVSQSQGFWGIEFCFSWWGTFHLVRALLAPPSCGFAGQSFFLLVPCVFWRFSRNVFGSAVLSRFSQNGYLNGGDCTC